MRGLGLRWAMPSSTPTHIPNAIEHLQSLQPTSILDVGVGYGKWGFLAREYLEAWNDRVHPESWQITIDGVEAWEPYTRLPWIDTVYNTVFHSTVQEWLLWRNAGGSPDLPEAPIPRPFYDVVICGDVIEHLTKEEGWTVLEELLQITKQSLILSIPIGEGWLGNKIVDENPHERHQSMWHQTEISARFKGPGLKLRKISHVGERAVALFFIPGRWKEPASLSAEPSRPHAWSGTAEELLVGAPRLAKHDVAELIKPEPPLVVEDLRPPSKVMLHVHNVQRCGGTGNFVYDLAGAFPEFTHHALCVNDPSGDPDWRNAVSDRLTTCYAPRLTPEVLDEIDPSVVVLHSTSGTQLGTGKPALDHPYAWLSGAGRRFVIAWHHTATHPMVAADLDVFVSKFVREKYEAVKNLDEWNTILTPPCTDLAPYLAIAERRWLDYQYSGGNQFVYTGAGKAGPELQGLMDRLNGQAAGSRMWIKAPDGALGSMPAHLARAHVAVIWSGQQETWCRTVTEAQAAGCLVMAHRAGAIPEHVIHGETGFLFDDLQDLTQQLEALCAKASCGALVQIQAIARAGREWARDNVGFPRLQRDLYPYLMRGVLGS